MYKITVDGKTMVGCNQDTWRTTTSIWFEKSMNETEYGVCFTGSRRVGPNEFAPQSGMNEEGLVFSRLVTYHPNKNLEQIGKKQITNEVEYLTDILHKCKTVEEVRKYIDMYDHSLFIDDVYIYIDKSGDYLIVEPYQMIKGNDPTYILANFCPSLTSNQDARKQMRYKNGDDYLRTNTLNTSLEFCRSVSDTMSVCRSRNGDGTF
jgi:penicillin V acylase-like amidase (Ntn superfamily)